MLGGVSTMEEFVALLKTMSDADLAKVAAGVDPEGGKVPEEFAKVARQEQELRAKGTQRGGASALKVLGAIALAGVGLWFLRKK